MIQIWKMPLKSGRDDFKNDPNKTQIAREFCFEKGFAGIGWEVPSLRRNVSRPELYEKALQSTKGNDRAALSAHRSFAYKMKKGDFIWSRARENTYWLARVKGFWRYKTSHSFSNFDLFQSRRVRWCRVGAVDRVPGPIKNAFAGRGSAVSRIKREEQITFYMTARIWERLTSEKVQSVNTALIPFSISHLGHDELEDLVGLYLQAEFGWYLAPSTANRSSPSTEFVLRNAKGQRAYLQVKSGAAKIREPIKVPNDVHRFYVFDASKEKFRSKKIHRISEKELKSFVSGHPRFLPEYW